MSRKCCWIFCLVTAAGLFAGSPVRAGTISSLGYDYFHRDLAKEYRSVGKIQAFDTIGAMPDIASGTLVRRKWVLTAAHVVDTASAMTFQIGSQQVAAKRWYVHKTWDQGEVDSPAVEYFLGNDIALVKLQRSIKSIKPSGFFNRGIEFGAVGTSVGYGATGTGTTGATFGIGIKRAGRNMIDVQDATTRKVLVYDFDQNPHSQGYAGPALDPFTGEISPRPKDYPIRLEYMIAPGDSGGPIFIGNRVAGVHSFVGGTFDMTNDSSFHDFAYSTRVKKWRRWLKRNIRRINRGNAELQALVGSYMKPIFETAPTEMFFNNPDAGMYLPLNSQPVPEPATLVFFGAAGAVVLGLRRRRR